MYPYHAAKTHQNFGSSYLEEVGCLEDKNSFFIRIMNYILLHNSVLNRK